jgi:hypothetical protein
LDRVATGIIGFEPAPPGAHAAFTLNTVQGGYSHYAALRAQEVAARSAVKSSGKTAGTAATGSNRSRAATRGAGDGPKPLSFKERRELEILETRIAEAEAALTQLQEALARPDSWQAGAGQANAQRAIDLDAAQADLAALYARWETLAAQQDAYETARARR